MENLNQILNREDTVNEIKKILQEFDVNCKNINFKKESICMVHPVQEKRILLWIF